MIDLDKKLTPYQWVMAILSIISIFLIILDFAVVISINQPTSKWFWINCAIVIFFAIDYFYHFYKADDKKHIYDLLSIICRLKCF